MEMAGEKKENMSAAGGMPASSSKEEQNDIYDCTKIDELRTQLHNKMKEKIKEFMKEAKKRGFDKKYITEIEIDGKKKKITISNGHNTYMRDENNVYYVSEFEVPSTKILVQGVKILQKVIEKFSELAKEDEKELKNALAAVEVL